MPENACPRRWGSFERPIPLDLTAGGAAGTDPEPAESEADSLARWKARQEQREGWSRSRREERRWEERWKAAGERLRAENAAIPTVTPAVPIAAVTPSLTERHEPRPVTPVAPRPPVAREVSPPIAAVTPVVAPASTSYGSRTVLAPNDWGRTPIPRRAESKAVPAVPRPEPVEPLSAMFSAPAAATAPTALPSIPESKPLLISLEAAPTNTDVTPCDWPDEGPYVADTNLGRTEPWADEGLLTSTLATPTVLPEPVEAAVPAAGRPAIRPVTRRARRTTTRLRPAAGVSSSLAPVPAPPSTPNSPESDRPLRLPTAREILAAHSQTAVSQPAPSRRDVKEPVPTTGREPAHWKVPVWLGWCAALPLTLAVGVTSLALAWCWSLDAEHAGVIAERLARGGKKLGPLPEWVRPPELKWWRTSPGRLTLWALERDRALNENDREGGHAAGQEVRELLEAARQASPLQAAAAFALARHGPDGDLRSSLSLSRDVVALSWTGKQRLAADQKVAALRAYREALEMAAQADLARLAAPVFNDETQIRRYALPAEDMIGPIVRELAGHGDWTYREWSAALPPLGVVRLAAVRALRERSSPDAPAALDALLAEADALIPATVGPSRAIHFAALGEALALKGRWSEAEQRYRQAIDLMTDSNVRRSWWMNLAEIALRLNDESNRQKALEAARGNDPNDEITRRAVELLKFYGVRNNGFGIRSTEDVTTNGLP